MYGEIAHKRINVPVQNGDVSCGEVAPVATAQNTSPFSFIGMVHRLNEVAYYLVLSVPTRHHKSLRFSDK